MKTLVILQSNYLPWKGYFDLMAASSEFVVFDEVQFTRRDWRNRNRIVLGGRLHWLTLPVQAKGNYLAPIDQIEIADRGWAEKHWTTIRHAYAKAPHFAKIGPALEQTYVNATELTRLSDVNALFLERLAGLLGIEARMVSSSSIPRTTPDPTERLIEICQARGATHYLSGPAARAYIKKNFFDDAGISLSYANYAGYPTYDQGTETFEHGVSIVDTLMRCGSTAKSHLKSLSRTDTFAQNRMLPFLAELATAH